MSGSLFIVSAPSGAGKSSLVNALLGQDARLSLSVSHTTRAPRGTEQDGREYHFVSRQQFMAMRDRGEFFESAEVHGNLYGTSRAAIGAQIAAGRDVVFEIDCQGAHQLRRVFRVPWRCSSCRPPWLNSSVVCAAAAPTARTWWRAG